LVPSTTNNKGREEGKGRREGKKGREGKGRAKIQSQAKVYYCPFIPIRDKYYQHYLLPKL
jgi:hypothetical protein